MPEQGSIRKIVYNEIETVPESLLLEILNFVRFLKTKPDMETYLLSYSTLAKDWLTPEEDSAWKDL